MKKFFVALLSGLFFSFAFYISVAKASDKNSAEIIDVKHNLNLGEYSV